MSVIDIDLPTLHPDQVRAYEVVRNNRFTALRCGRRWGKTDFDKTLACDAAIKKWPVGWFAPEYKFISEAYNEIHETLDPVIKQSSKTEGVIRLITGGRIDFWSLENNRAGRSRKYKVAIVDEGAFAKPVEMMETWEKSIKPTLLDYNGSAIVSSNTNGIDPGNFFYQICPRPGEIISKYGFAEYHAPTSGNPHVPERIPGDTDEEHALKRAAALEELRTTNHPLVYSQEHLAEFVDWSGVAFFSRDKLLEDGHPLIWPARVDSVFAVIDTSSKTGKEHDGTGVVYYGYIKYPTPRLVILDWDYQQIEGDLLITWLPNVFQQLDEFAASCKSRGGSIGAFIEDKDSGVILLQQAQRLHMRVTPLPSTLTALGKDGRAISVSGYVYRNLVKITQRAFDKVVTYKRDTRNHLLGQVEGFRVGDKDAAKRADDLLDCFTYGTAIAFGNAEGF